MGLSAILLASASPPEVPESSCIVAPVLTQRLPGGSWQGQDTAGEAITVIFYRNGLAQWSHAGASSASVELYDWQAIAGNEGCAFLKLTDKQSGQASTYVVDLVSNQLQLVADGASKVVLKQVKVEKEYERRRMLNGSWGNTTYPFEVSRERAPDMKKAFLQYRFSEDGSFVRQLGNQKREIQEEGTYLVSDDNDYVLLLFDNGCITVVALKYLQLDELVLQHVLRCEDPAFSTGRKDFYFNKL